MINKRGFRLNVGIILVNEQGRVFLGKRAGHKDAWQFPQGGVNSYETLEETLYRELREEIGLESTDVKRLGVTKKWLYYRLPHAFQRHQRKPLCVGQKQRWFLLELITSDSKIYLDNTSSPEFSEWRWVSYWFPLRKVIAFKREVYKKALKELRPILLKKLGS